MYWFFTGVALAVYPFLVYILIFSQDSIRKKDLWLTGFLQMVFYWLLVLVIVAIRCVFIARQEKIYYSKADELKMKLK